MDVTGNPWIVLAADVAAANIVIWPYQAHILQIEFSGGANGDTATVFRNTPTPKEFWSGEIGADLKSVRSGTLGWTGTHGLMVKTGGIPHGELKIYHR